MHSWLGRWMSRLKLIRISRIAIVVTFLLSLVFAGFTIYGAQVGNFVISIQDSDKYLSLSEYDDLSNKSMRLTAPGIDAIKMSQYTEIPSNISSGIGSKNGLRVSDVITENSYIYFAYSFYLINVSSETIDVAFEINISEYTNELDKSVRILVIEENNDKASGYIFGKAPENADETWYIDGTPDDEKYELREFLSSSQVCNTTISAFEAGAAIKYTVVMWIDGWDREADNRVLGYNEGNVSSDAIPAKIKLDLLFTKLDTYVE